MEADSDSNPNCQLQAWDPSPCPAVLLRHWTEHFNIAVSDFGAKISARGN